MSIYTERSRSIGHWLLILLSPAPPASSSPSSPSSPLPTLQNVFQFASRLASSKYVISTKGS
ncbi:hypothetical protein [Nostoc sp.]|uniref:hypothetical protein n=1 Tax=Nostoc sp. TaxID=1180 RepID=UPI002FFC4602